MRILAFSVLDEVHQAECEQAGCLAIDRFQIYPQQRLDLPQPVVEGVPVDEQRRTGLGGVGVVSKERLQRLDKLTRALGVVLQQRNKELLGRFPRAAPRSRHDHGPEPKFRGELGLIDPTEQLQ